MGDTFRDGKVHVMAERCNACAFTPHRIVPGSRVAQIVRDTKDEPGAHFICHKATLSEHDAICHAWFETFGESDPILFMASRMGIIEPYTPTDHPDGSQ
jgi:hypothetical protein